MRIFRFPACGKIFSCEFIVMDRELSKFEISPAHLYANSSHLTAVNLRVANKSHTLTNSCGAETPSCRGALLPF